MWRQQKPMAAFDSIHCLVENIVSLRVQPALGSIILITGAK